MFWSQFGCKMPFLPYLFHINLKWDYIYQILEYVWILIVNKLVVLSSQVTLIFEPSQHNDRPQRTVYGHFYLLWINPLLSCDQFDTLFDISSLVYVDDVWRSCNTSDGLMYSYLLHISKITFITWHRYIPHRQLCPYFYHIPRYSHYHLPSFLGTQHISFTVLFSKNQYRIHSVTFLNDRLAAFPVFSCTGCNVFSAGAI